MLLLHVTFLILEWNYDVTYSHLTKQVLTGLIEIKKQLHFTVFQVLEIHQQTRKKILKYNKEFLNNIYLVDE